MSDPEIIERDAVNEIEAVICGEVAGTSGSEDARGRLAAAIGRQASGYRATAVFSGEELMRSIDLLRQAVERRLPLVVHLSVGEDHRAYHAAATTGALLLFASDAREAVDLTLIARRSAEAALLPAVVATDAAFGEFDLPEPALVSRYLGDADETIHPPTPGQQMLFGKHRRRVPRWHDLERPLLSGARLGAEAAGAMAAAGRACFEGHLPEFLDEAFGIFEAVSGRRYDAVSDYRLRRAKLVLIAQGAAVPAAMAVAGRLREERGPRVGVLGIRSLRPLPAERLVEWVPGRRPVAVLERLDAPAGVEAPLTAEIRSALEQRALPPLTTVFYGQGASGLREADLQALCQELTDKKAARRSPVYLGLGGDSAAGYPKLEAHLDAMHRTYPAIHGLRLRADLERPSGRAEATDPPMPLAAIRRMAASSTPLADPAGFGDRVGMLYRDGSPDPVPDPFLASGTVPPLAAALTAPTRAPSRRLTEERTLPVFEPGLCTGCGACWSVCPDGAVGPLPISPRALLDAGMRLAGRHGRSVDKLRMVASKLTDRVAKTTATGGSCGEILNAAFEPMINRMKLPADRKIPVCDAFGAVREELAELPVARTGPFFDSAGDLLALAVDPDACQGCGLCVAECEPKALVAEPDSHERTSAARDLWRLVQELPKPGSAALERASADPEVGPLAGALLSPSAREVMTVADTEPGSGEALAARQVLGFLETLRRPIRARYAADVDDLRTRIASAIHDELADALPDRDLEALARGLDALNQPDAELAELTERVETAFETERVDVVGTRRLVEAGRRLADLAWRLEKGEGGLGSSPFGLVLSGKTATWGGTFPHNPFAVPVTIATTGDGVALARGLLEGHRRRTLEDVRLLRQARAELERVGGRRSGSEDELVWEALDADERQLCPPLVLLASEAELEGSALGPTLDALATDLPLKVIALADLGAGCSVGNNGTSALTALSVTGAYVAQTSIADFEHLGQALTAAFAHGGSAFVRLLAPSPGAGGFSADATLEQARVAVAAGDFSLWSSSPAARAGRTLADLLAPPDDAAVTDVVVEPVEPAPDVSAVAEIEQRHAAELASMQARYEAYIAQLRAGLKTEMAREVHGKLMRLVAEGRGPSGIDGNLEAET